MGVDFIVVALNPKQLEAMAKDPSTLEAFVFPDGDTHPDGLLMPRSFEMLSHALTGTGRPSAPPLGVAIAGGTTLTTPDNLEFFALSPTEVKAVSAALEGISEKRFRSLFDANIKRDGYYGVPDGEREDACASLYSDLKPLRAYYVKAAKRDKAILKYFW